ncbi:MAG: hypothetical protein OEZ16_02955 [Chromatiales bacterium]|nr:hypothetical protein [Chromatiales bacterium]
MKGIVPIVLLLLAPTVSAELMPRDVTEAELSREVHWCGILRETSRDDKQIRFIYDSLTLKGREPTLAACEKLYANPGRFSSGLFVLQRPAAAVPEWMVSSFSQPTSVSNCQFIGIHSGTVQGFVDYQGMKIPYIEAEQYPQKCMPLLPVQ